MKIKLVLTVLLTKFANWFEGNNETWIFLQRSTNEWMINIKLLSDFSSMIYEKRIFKLVTNIETKQQ